MLAMTCPSRNSSSDNGPVIRAAATDDHVPQELFYRRGDEPGVGPEPG